MEQRKRWCHLVQEWPPPALATNQSFAEMVAFELGLEGQVALQSVEKE